MPTRSYLIGVGMTAFKKPSDANDERSDSYPDMAKEAIVKALIDAGITYDAVEQAAVGYCFGPGRDSIRRLDVRPALYSVGMTQVPIINVNNNCSTGSTALYIVRQVCRCQSALQAVEGGLIECGLALGFEKMSPGPLGAKPVWTDRESPLNKMMKTMASQRGVDRASPPNPQIFGNAGIEHMEKYGTTTDHFAKIGWKNHKHSVNNPYSQFQKEYSLDEVKNGRKIWNYLSLLQCCPTSDGAACVIVASEDFVHRHKLEGQAVEIVAQSLATDSHKAYETSSIELAGADMTRRAAADVFKKAKLTANDVQVVELHDCFSANELITYEALGLCPVGKAGEYIDAKQNTYGGKHVVNPSGGLISKGHPLGATGLAQCTELTWQVRGWAGKRQVPNVKNALQHNVGLGGAVVVSVLSKGFPNVPTPKADARLGYNAAVECRKISDADLARVQPRDTTQTAAIFSKL